MTPSTAARVTINSRAGPGTTRSTRGAGNDDVYGDLAFNVNLLLFAQDQIARFDANDAGQLAKINAMFTVPTTPTPGADHLYGGDGADVIFGDHGVITQVSGTRRIETTGAIARIETTREDVGGADTIQGNAGNDIILGGQLGDVVDGNEGNNIILGDHGYVDYVVADGDHSDFDAIVSTSTTNFGGADQITAGAGQDTIIGGRFGDTINAGDGDNLIIGDSGRILAVAFGAPQLAGLPITLGTVETIEVADGGNDLIVAGGGKDIVLGGAQSDDIRAGAGNDIVDGDNAQLGWTADNDAFTLDTLTTTANAIGGSDTICGEEGDDVLIGGAAGDRIDGGDGRDLIFGDNVRLDRTIGDGMANARYRTLTGAEGGQIYSTLPGTAGTVLVNSASSTHPGWRAGLGGLQHRAPRPRPRDADSGRQQLRQRLHRGRRGQRPDLRPARQRHDPGRRLDRPRGRRDAPCRRHAGRPALGGGSRPTATTTSRATAATT